MNKETLIVLIEKDISELQSLTAGFSTMNSVPQPLLDLALTKVDALRNCLAELPAATTEPKEEKIDIAEPQLPEQEQQMPDTEEIVVESEPEKVEVEPEPAEPEPQPNETPAPNMTASTLADTIQKPETVIESFERQEDNTLATNIAKQPVADLKQAISIADRFRFQRELFANNGELMAITLDKLNACTSLAEAETYVANHCQFPTDGEATADFIDLLKRRFV